MVVGHPEEDGYMPVYTGLLESPFPARVVSMPSVPCHIPFAHSNRGGGVPSFFSQQDNECIIGCDHLPKR